MTRRLYYDDPYLTEFQAEVAECTPEGVYLAASAFYPTSGGQPFDTGHIGAAKVIDVIDEGDRIRHVVEGQVAAGTATAKIDWTRRFDHMQQHTGQHLLSAVLHESFGITTVSFHLGSDESTIDIETANFDSELWRAAEEHVNRIVFENRPVSVSYHDAADEGAGLRKATERTGTIRVVSIEGIDKSACGGTHVRQTGEIGPVQIRRSEKIRGITRIAFLCGWRALRQSKTDFEAAARVARVFSSSLDDAPALVEAQRERLADLDKAYKKLAREAAQTRGRDLYMATAVNGKGVRFASRMVRGGLNEELQAEAQGFAAGEGAVFLIASEDPAAVLVAVGPGVGEHAGKFLKPLLEKFGGRGGGAPNMAQGSVPGTEQLSALVAALRDRFA
jgi:alanyl-tRNA synthetase